MVKVTDLKFALIYATDFDQTKEFYQKYFGFKEAFEMDNTSLGPQTWGHIGDTAMWIGGGHENLNITESSARAGVMFGVDSTSQLFSELKADNVTIYQEEPIEMQPGVFWMQFQDPSGNIIEVLGGK